MAEIQNAITLTAKDFQMFELSIERTGAFPPHGLPRVLWLGVKDNSETLSRLQSKLEDEFASIGFKKETRKFHPHITLARIRTHEGAKNLREKHERIDFQSDSFVVDEIVLMKSELLPTGGSRYTKLSSHQLK